MNKQPLNRAWWFTPLIPALGKLSQKNLEFEASLGYMEIPCLRTPKNRAVDMA
jgi:hypothetical protein